MIDEKKIEEAAKECRFNTIAQMHSMSFAHKATVFREEVDLETELIENAFIAGVNWFQENLWHDASEEPKEAGKYLLCKCSNGEYLIHIMEPTPDEWQERCEFIGITRWLYIEDLM